MVSLCQVKIGKVKAHISIFLASFFSSAVDDEQTECASDSASKPNYLSVHGHCLWGTHTLTSFSPLSSNCKGSLMANVDDGGTVADCGNWKTVQRSTSSGMRTTNQ